MNLQASQLGFVLTRSGLVSWDWVAVANLHLDAAPRDELGNDGAVGNLFVNAFVFRSLQTIIESMKVGR